MDESVARWLTSDAAAPALAAAMAEPDPTSVAAATRLRRSWTPAQSAAVLQQAALRRRATAKFGDAASTLFFAADGLEQATRPRVAAARAARFAAQGIEEVVDLGCGIGADALAFAGAGLRVTGVELDPATAVLAQANLAGANLGEPNLGEPNLAGANLGEPNLGEPNRASVERRARIVVGDAEQVAARLLTPRTAVFCDPARRTSRGRTWRVEDFTPRWTFVTSLLAGDRPASVKLGPGLPASLIPDAVEAEWVSDRGTVVEATLWAGGDAVPGRRRATVDGEPLWADGPLPEPGVTELADYLYEPDGAVIRARLVPDVAARVAGGRVQAGIAYLTSSTLVQTPFAEAFVVREVLPFREKVLRAWVRERGVGVLEIKKRGVDVDPAALRRRLRPSGSASATLILTPTTRGAVAAVAERVLPATPAALGLVLKHRFRHPPGNP